MGATGAVGVISYVLCLVKGAAGAVGGTARHMA